MNSSLFDLKGRVALVTGASRGLGKVIARGLAQAGANIVITSRNESDLKTALADILSGTQAEGRAIAADLVHRRDIDAFTRDAEQQFGHIDILINNAGATGPQEIDAIDDETWDRILNVNLTGAMALSRAVVRGMKQRRWGRIIHMSSINGINSRRGRAAYSASKAGLIGLTRAMAFDLGPFGITVNALAPGIIMTELSRSLAARDGSVQIFADHTALKRPGEPGELIGPVLMLASEAGSYVTGTTLVVDGGMVAHVGPPSAG